MTALKQYQRLESPGIWRPEEDAQRRNVIVTFGEASLVITDRSDSPLTHWSLAALIRQNPSERPALYRPGPDATETLEIEDDTMIDAIEKIRRAVTRSTPRPGRLRLALSVSGGAFIAAVILFILPSVLVRHTASVVPPPLRQEIGAQLLDRVGRLSGSACSTRSGEVALERLSRRLFASDPPRLVIVPAGVTSTSHLPGGIILANRSLVEDFEGPEALAGYLLAENTRRQESDPLRRLLKAAGSIASFRLLTTGKLPGKALDDYAEALLTLPNAPIGDDMLLSLFAEAKVSSQPYAFAVDLSGETTLGLIEADPIGDQSNNLLLSDADWVRLQSICGE